MTGNAVVAYMLDGIPEIYRQFFFVPECEDIQALKQTLEQALYATSVEIKEKYERAYAYISSHLTSVRVAEKIITEMTTCHFTSGKG